MTWVKTNQDQQGRRNSKSGNRRLPVWPDSTAGLQARSCILVVERAEAVTEKEQQREIIS